MSTATAERRWNCPTARIIDSVAYTHLDRMAAIPCEGPEPDGLRRICAVFMGVDVTNLAATMLPLSWLQAS